MTSVLHYETRPPSRLVFFSSSSSFQKKKKSEEEEVEDTNLSTLAPHFFEPWYFGKLPGGRAAAEAMFHKANINESQCLSQEKIK